MFVHVDNALQPLRATNPSLQHIKLDKKKADEAFSELLKVLKCHTRSTEFMMHFFKEPLIVDCVCKACKEDPFTPVRMPRSIYEKVKEFPMPMPILRPKGVGEVSEILAYMSFDEAQVLPFTDEHQPSLAAALLRAVVATKKKQAHQRSQLGSTRVTYTTAPNITKFKNKASFKIASASRVRGSVVCNNCIRPRCMYS